MPSTECWADPEQPFDLNDAAIEVGSRVNEVINVREQGARRTQRQEIVVETTSDWALSTPVLVTAVTAK